MFWNNLSFARKLFVAFFLVISGFLTALLIFSILQNNILDHADNAFEKRVFTQNLTLRQLDHLRWTETLGNWLANHGHGPLTVQPDGTKCALGKWYLGEGRERLEALLPNARTIFSKMNDPHLKLHASALQLQQLLQEGREEDALRLYSEVSRKMSTEVVAMLDNVRQMVDNAAQEDQISYRHAADLSLMQALVISFLALALALIMGIVLQKTVAHPLARIVGCATRIKDGDLTCRIGMQGRHDEVGILAETLGQMTDSLKEKIHEAEVKSEQALESAQTTRQALQTAEENAGRAADMLKTLGNMGSTAHEIAESLGEEATHLADQVQQVMEGSKTQGDKLDSVATAMEQVNGAVNDIARSAAEAAESAISSLHKAESGADVVVRSMQAISKVNEVSDKMRASMQTLGTEAESIGQVMNVISDIADQTNLLALNAAIEAARAGEAGRGFAVVADEVRKLAEKTMQATQEVGSKIKSIQSSVQTGVTQMEESAAAVGSSMALANESGESLKEIVELANVNASSAHSIAAASEQQSAACREITGNLGHVAEIAEISAEEMGHAVESVRRVVGSTSKLRDLIRNVRKVQEQNA